MIADVSSIILPHIFTNGTGKYKWYYLSNIASSKSAYAGQSWMSDNV